MTFTRDALGDKIINRIGGYEKLTNVRLTSGYPWLVQFYPAWGTKRPRAVWARPRTLRADNYPKARLQLTRLRHIDVSFCQRRSWPQNTPRGVLRVADPANSHHNYFLSNPRIASPLLTHHSKKSPPWNIIRVCCPRFTRVNAACSVIRVASPKSREGRRERGYHN